MKAALVFLAAIAAALELITDQIKRYVDQKKQIECQKKHDDIDRNPAGAFVRKFRDKGNKAADPGSDSGKRN